jgi:MSHA biogenesis protein MshQ
MSNFSALSFYTLVLLFLVALPTRASYTMTELVATPLDVPDTVNTVVWDNTDTSYPDDDDKQTVAIGFPFQFDNTAYNDVTILTNGILKFGAIERMHRDYQNEALDTNEGDRFVAIYWDDLVDDASSSVTYGIAGTAPNRSFIVNWTNVRAYSNNLRYDFQVVLYENGDIRYRYNNNTANGQSATIGLEIDDTDFVQYSFNQVSVEVSFDLLFRNDLLALPTPIAQYRLDEESWNSTANEVADSSGNAIDGTAYNGTLTSDVSPALGTTIGTCRYGEFDGINDFVEVADNNSLDFTDNFSVSAWIKISSIPVSGLKTIVSKNENYEFHVNSSGLINWWWQTGGGVTQSFNSTTAIVPGIWTHVVISYSDGNQTIYINGAAAGGATFGGAVANNSDPLQIASDQGSSSRYFNGDIDEVNIFDQRLIQSQVIELMNQTRPCSSFNLCVSSFPDGLNSHSNGAISFNRDAQLFFSPDDILDAGSIAINGGSTQRTCVSVECQANGLAVDPTVPQSFPDTSTHTTDINIGNNNSGNMGGAENQYRNITLGNNSNLNVLAGFNDYYIDDLSAGNNATMTLIAGTYWFNNFSAGNNLNISIAGAGTARIYINNAFTLPRDALINSPSSGVQGDASRLLIYGYDSINTGRDSTVSGVIYAIDDIEIDRGSDYFGAITGADISIGRDTNVFFNPLAAANLDYGNLCQSASCTLGSFNISQPAYALVCPGTRSKVSIQAMCDDGSSIKDDYAGTVDLTSNENTLSEFYASLISVPVINSIVFDGTESGTKDVYLFHQNENLTLQVIATDAAIPVSTTSTNATDYRTSGFAITNEPNAFICGNSESMSLTAVGEDSSGASCQVLTGFTGSKAMKVWYGVNIDSLAGADPVSTSLSVASQSITDQSEPAVNNVNLTFTNGVATYPLEYTNAGQILSVNFKHDDAPYDNSVPELSGVTLNASTGSFVVKPNQINLAISTANSACSPANATCSKFVPAGSPFVVDVEAQCVGGGIADDYQGAVILGHTLVAPLPGDAGALSVASATVSAVDAGSIQISNQVISEVGIFNLTSVDNNYFGEVIGQFTLPNIGRFYPDHFIMSSNSTTNSCGSFSYMSQTSDEIDVSYTLQAHKFGGGITQNYDGAFAKANMSLVAENDDDGGAYQARFSGFITTNWVDGEYIYSDGGNFSRAALGAVDGPYQDLQVGLQFNDNDGNDSILNGLDMKADTTGACGIGCDAKLIGLFDVRFGQLTLSNVFGPETFDLIMNVQTEYFNGTDFILNTDDTCTNLSDANLIPVAGSWVPNLEDGETAPTLATNITAGTGGVGGFSFSAAGLGNEGSVDFQYDTINVLPWLNTENDNSAGYDDNPEGKITFGQFRGNDRMIYWREVVR